MASPLADYVVSLGHDGRIACQGSVADALKKDKTLAKELAEGARAIKDNEKIIDAEAPNETAKSADGKLILAEEIAEGHVSWDAGEGAIERFGISDSKAHWCTHTLSTKMKSSCLLMVWEERTQPCFGYWSSAACYFAKPLLPCRRGSWVTGPSNTTSTRRSRLTSLSKCFSSHHSLVDDDWSFVC